MAEEWHYSKGSQQHGPVSASDLKALAKSGELSSKDLIWKEGMADWKAAGSLNGLFPPTPESPSPQKSPPPLPVERVVLPEQTTADEPLWKRCIESPVRYLGSALGVALLCSLLLVSAVSPDEFIGRLVYPPLFLADVILSILLIVLSIIRHGYKFDYMMLPGKWHPADRRGEPLEFLGLNRIARGDTLSGTYTLHKDKKIEIVSDGKVIECWKLVKVNGTELVFHDATGAMKKYKRNLGNPFTVLFDTKRTNFLEGVWHVANDTNEWIQFTKDGAVVFSNGSAGRFSVLGQEPHEVIELQLVDGMIRELQVVSLTSNQFVIAEGNEATTFKRLKNGIGKPSSVAAIEPARRFDQPDDESGSSTSKGIAGGLFAFFFRYKCPKCGQRSGKKQATAILDRRQEVRSMPEGSLSSTVMVQRVVDITLWESTIDCQDCGHQWCEQSTTTSRA